MQISRSIIVLLLLCTFQGSVAQVFTGNWYGRAETKTSHSYNTYLCEMVLTQKKGVVSGKLNYYFGSYEWSSIVAGNVFEQTQTLELDPFKLITFFAQNPNGADCQMDGSLTLYVYEGDTILYGQFNPFGNHRIGCPVMTVMLKKEKLHEEKRREDFQPPSREELDTIPVIFQPEESKPAPTQEKLLTERTFLPGPLFEVTTDSIEVHLYDNARVDNDTVTVFFNRQMVAEKKRLSLKPIIIKLGLKQGINEIAMYANNIGDIPPNTALCIIYAGADRYDINLSSTLLTNGTVRVRRRE